jgi:hypothetical protein
VLKVAKGAGFAEPIWGGYNPSHLLLRIQWHFFALSADRKRSPQRKKMPLSFRKVAWVVELEATEQAPPNMLILCEFHGSIFQCPRNVPESLFSLLLL